MVIESQGVSGHFRLKLKNHELRKKWLVIGSFSVFGHFRLKVRKPRVEKKVFES